jgi:hypothetical protein
MKRKGDPTDRQFEFFLEFFNTPGNEVAPRSDVIGENIQDDVVCHVEWVSFPFFDGVAESRHLPRYRAFPGARNTTCMTAFLEKHDALYMATSAKPSG